MPKAKDYAWLYQKVKTLMGFQIGGFATEERAEKKILAAPRSFDQAAKNYLDMVFFSCIPNPTEDSGGSAVHNIRIPYQISPHFSTSIPSQPQKQQSLPSSHAWLALTTTITQHAQGQGDKGFPDR